jgi:mono/diheme cytochrome c family protein
MIRLSHCCTLFAVLLAAPGGGLFAAAPARTTPAVSADHARQMAQGRELFSRKVRALLADNCLKCHGGGVKLRGGLNLATRETLLGGGDSGVVVVPGKGKQSKLYRLAAHLDEPPMPPKGNKPLDKNQLADLARWIDLGAPYDKPLIDRPGSPKPKTLVVTAADRDFWSFRPLKRPPLPAVKNASWGRNPIDRFLLAKMEEKGLAPSPEAGRRALLRRAYCNLIGLPPAADEAAAFVAGKGAADYERLVDRLLANPHHGERWARHWLDLARFAESHGFEHDYDRPTAYPYRDFVIKALNRDLPYNTFVRWQLAGDEIEPDNPLALTATGFLGAGVHSTQITAATVEKERYDELDDILRTTGTAMLGLTIGCARCHDHKYDPIPQKDYYSLLSTFTTTVRTNVTLDLDPELSAGAYQRHSVALGLAQKELREYERDRLPGKLTAWLKSGKKAPSGWSIVKPVQSRSSGGARFTDLPDGSLLAGGTNAAFDTYTFVIHTKTKGITAIRLEALAHSSMVRGGPGRAGNGNFALSDFKITAAPLSGDKPAAVKIARARATFEQRGLPVAAAIDADPRSAWAVDPQFGKNHAAVFDLASPIGHDGGTVLTITLRFNNNTGHNIGRPRLSISTCTNPPAVAGDGVPDDVRTILSRLESKPGAAPTEKEQAVLLSWYRGLDAEWGKLNSVVAALERKGPGVALKQTMICSEGLPPIRLHSQGADFLEQTHFLKRGDPNQKEGVARQGFLQVLMRSEQGEKRWQQTPPSGWRTSYRRRSLANWITDTEQGAGHLLARVLVNRLWQHHFGRGIVATTSDFGAQGERPTHPELLDWLASELIAQGWRLKPIHRLIVTSAAYRQSAGFDAGKAKIDPDNRFLWRRTPRRLDAEVIRDSLLAVSGELEERMFGPGTLDPNHKRRSIYFFVKRSQLPPMMVLFDAPDGVVGIEQRTTTTIAPQALLMMNGSTVRAAAARLAARVGGRDLEQVVRRAYFLALSRAPKAAELAEAREFLREQRLSYRQEKKPNAEQLALTDFCQVLLGLNEFIYVD